MVGRLLSFWDGLYFRHENASFREGIGGDMVGKAFYFWSIETCQWDCYTHHVGLNVGTPKKIQRHVLRLANNRVSDEGGRFLLMTLWLRIAIWVTLSKIICNLQLGVQREIESIGMFIIDFLFIHIIQSLCRFMLILVLPKDYQTL